MATVTKGPYFWDIRGSSAARESYGLQHANEIPQGSTYLETDGDHDIYIWNADTKMWEEF